MWSADMVLSVVTIFSALRMWMSDRLWTSTHIFYSYYAPVWFRTCTLHFSVSFVVSVLLETYASVTDRLAYDLNALVFSVGLEKKTTIPCTFTCTCSLYGDWGKTVYFRLLKFFFILYSYRLAPEHTAPAALDDCLAVTKHIISHAAALGIDVQRLGIMGKMLVTPWTYSVSTFVVLCSMHVQNV